MKIENRYKVGRMCLYQKINVRIGTVRMWNIESSEIPTVHNLGLANIKKVWNFKFI